MQISVAVTTASATQGSPAVQGRVGVRPGLVVSKTSSGICLGSEMFLEEAEALVVLLLNAVPIFATISRSHLRMRFEG